MLRRTASRTKELQRMIDEGFFDDHQPSPAVRSELIRRGQRSLCNNIEEALLRFVRKGKLERVREDVDNTYFWVYRKPEGAFKDGSEEFFFKKGCKYDFYRALADVLTRAQKRVMLVDGYITDDVFDLYFGKLPPETEIRILTRPETPKGSFYKVARRFKAQHSSFEVRESLECHDRLLFLDSDAWIFGQSIKSAGNKPTYLVKLRRGHELRRMFDSVWANSKKTI